MSFFTNAHNTVISAHNLTMNAYSSSRGSDRVTREGFDMLYKNATPSALYGSTTSYSAKDRGCLHGTRLDVQEHVFRWLNNPESQVVMWMYGPAGIGKTAIAYTIAKLCEERKQLLSAFFFFRSDGGQNSAKHLVPTVAYGMLQQMPHTRDIACTTTADDPLIFSAPLERQIATIILPALSEPFPPSQGSPPSTMLFIINGLDECTDTGMQQSIIQSFISLLATTTTPIHYKILIVSRPESHIVSAFSAVQIACHVNHLCLDKWKSIMDIEIFLHAKLGEVKQTHPLKSYLNTDWPLDDPFKKLLHKSFESFAYATSAVRYISSHDRHPETSLSNLLGLNPDCAYEAHAHLDTLYCHILESLDEKTLHTVLKVLCLMSCSTITLANADTMGPILGEEIFAVKLAMIKISSVIHFERHIRRFSYYHTSFSDFLRDKQRSGRLYLYSPKVAAPVAEALISTVWVPTDIIHTAGIVLAMSNIDME